MKERCRHRNSWLLAGGLIEWCYECGAFRKMRRTNDLTILAVGSCWAYPVGRGNPNPWNVWQHHREVWEKRMATIGEKP